ncbi:hypothetical protein CARUB_v10006604mg [Capsella rubella]|uniref:Uncharacterized protein n=1 Tax=Capsella rubella TaxID=81985 RepID=R0F8A5_9BRAS|nr:probable transcription factor At1g61730 [Capsella rubella]EOA18142.1 hypothetical protein CARUB_v10006604mg [Capsella rubella]
MVTKKISSEEEEEDSRETSSEEDEASSEDEEPTKEQTPSKAAEKAKGQKRVSERTSSQDMSAAKKVKSSVKKSVPPQLWRKEDELILLQGIIRCKTGTSTKFNPSVREKIYNFIKGSISFKVSLKQCTAKIHAVRSKYQKKLDSGKKPSGPQDLKAFELAKEIWGLSGTSDAKESRKSEKIQKLEEEKDVMIHEQGEDWFKNSILYRVVTILGMEKDKVKSWSCVAKEKKKIMLDRWSDLEAKDAEIVHQKTAYVHDLICVILEASPSH